MVKAAYTTSLGGEEHLDSYHWERPMSELEALDRQDEERQGEVDEGGPVEEQVNEREVQVTSEEEEEEKIRSNLLQANLSLCTRMEGAQPNQWSRSCPRW